MSADEDIAGIKKELSKHILAINKKLRLAADALASTAATDAKQDPGGFTDQSGNLRNSIYWIPAGEERSIALFKTVESEGSFQKIPAGVQTLKKSTGVQATVCAGMVYGRHVEFILGHYVFARAINNLVQNGDEILRKIFK